MIKIKLDDIDLVAFYGAGNSNIDYIISKYPNLKIVVRGETLSADGDKPELELFEIKINRLINYFAKYGHISKKIIDQMLDYVPVKSIDKNDDNDSETNNNTSFGRGYILHGNNGVVIRARSDNQLRIVDAVKNNDLVFVTGPAGSGKTYIAIALAVRALKEREVKRVILTRPAVEAGERLGFLPGDMKEKLDPYLQPLYDALHDMIPQKKLEQLIEEGVVQIAPLAYMRGRTLDNAFVILDEAQNTTLSQLKMFLTRMGKSAKFMVTGDTSQIDLPSKDMSGLVKSMEILRNVNGIALIEMKNKDIVRHQLVKDIVDAFDSVL